MKAFEVLLNGKKLCVGGIVNKFLSLLVDYVEQGATPLKSPANKFNRRLSGRAIILNHFPKLAIPHFVSGFRLQAPASLTPALRLNFKFAI